MILDSAKVSLSDGTHEAAISLFPGRQLLSFLREKPTHARVVDRKIETSVEVIGLVLSNGERLCGSRDQKVGVWRNHRICFTSLPEIRIGDFLRGECAGKPTVVRVIGLLFFPKHQVRLVELATEHQKNFVANGVLCK